MNGAVTATLIYFVRWPVHVALLSRLSFPATGPPGPGTDFKAPGSPTHHRFRHLLEGFSKGS